MNEILDDPDHKHEAAPTPNRWVSGSLVFLFLLAYVNPFLGLKINPLLLQVAVISSIGYHLGYLAVTKGRDVVTLLTSIVIILIVIWDIRYWSMASPWFVSNINIRIHIVLLAILVIALTVFLWNRPNKKKHE